MLKKTLPTLQDIRDAADRIRPYVHDTPVFSSAYINSIVDGEVFLKCENLQKAGAFKSRGACNAVFSLDDKTASKGVATHSSGNHAQALARAAGLRGCPAYIVMPDNSSQVKIDAVKEYGGWITFCKPLLSSRESTLAKVIEETGSTEIHPYNEYRIIEAQATAAIELIEEVADLDVIMAPVGGGGLLSGTALAGRYLNPEIQILAAEPKGADDAYRSFYSGDFVPSENPQTIADGLLTSMGTLTWPIIKEHVDDILITGEDSIISTMKMVWERMKIIIEPSSAVPLAAVLDTPSLFKGKRTGIIISGGNVDLQKLPWKEATS